MALVQRDGIVRDFLSRSVVPCGRGYRRVKTRRAGVVHVPSTPTTRLFFPCAARNYMVVSGPLGAVRIGPSRAMVLLALCARPDDLIDYVTLSESVWPNPDDMPDGWHEVLQAHLSAVRRLLRTVGSEISIVTFFGMGVSVRRAPVASNDDAELKQVSNA